MTDSGFIEVDGGRLYFEADGSGHPLVLVHAGVANLRQWDAQVPVFAEHYRVIRYDTRGWGQSETEQVEFANRADLATVLDQLGERSAYLLGLSRGGSIVLDFALDYAERTDALIFAAGGSAASTRPIRPRKKQCGPRSSGTSRHTTGRGSPTSRPISGSTARGRRRTASIPRFGPASTTGS